MRVLLNHGSQGFGARGGLRRQPRLLPELGGEARVSGTWGAFGWVGGGFRWPLVVALARFLTAVRRTRYL